MRLVSWGVVVRDACVLYSTVSCKHKYATQNIKLYSQMLFAEHGFTRPAGPLARERRD